MPRYVIVRKDPPPPVRQPVYDDLATATDALRTHPDAANLELVEILDSTSEPIRSLTVRVITADDATR